MGFVLEVFLASLGLFVGMVVLFRSGRRLGRRYAAQDSRAATSPSAVETTVFALLGLLLAFTFSGAADRFDTRRRMIIDERNAIDTAYLRLDLLPSSSRSEVQELFREYVDSRLAMYRVLPDVGAAMAIWEQDQELQHEIWERAVAALDAEGAQATSRLVVLPALNTMFDQAAARVEVMLIHPPVVVFELLFGLALVSALLAGYGSAHRRSAWFDGIAYAATMAVVVYIIIDLEHPRVGLIRVGDFDRVLTDLRAHLR
jgi:hypothetical protein